MKAHVACAALIGAIALSGCAGLPSVDQIGTHKNLGRAISADVGTTTLTQLFTQRTELNPIVAGCAKAIGLGPHAGIIVCAVAAGIVAYQIITHIDNLKLTAAAVVIESGMAVRNVYVFGH